MQSELDAIDLRNRVRQRLNTAIARICRHNRNTYAAPPPNWR